MRSVIRFGGGLSGGGRRYFVGVDDRDFDRLLNPFVDIVIVQAEEKKGTKMERSTVKRTDARR